MNNSNTQPSWEVEARVIHRQRTEAVQCHSMVRECGRKGPLKSLKEGDSVVMETKNDAEMAAKLTRHGLLVQPLSNNALGWVSSMCHAWLMGHLDRFGVHVCSYIFSCGVRRGLDGWSDSTHDRAYFYEYRSEPA